MSKEHSNAIINIYTISRGKNHLSPSILHFLTLTVSKNYTLCVILLRMNISHIYAPQNSQESRQTHSSISYHPNKARSVIRLSEPSHLRQHYVMVVMMLHSMIESRRREIYTRINKYRTHVCNRIAHFTIHTFVFIGYFKRRMSTEIPTCIK